MHDARVRRVISALCALATISGCGDDPVRIVGGACAFGDEHRIAIPEGPVVHDVALASDGTRAWAVWSDPSGAFAREIDGTGVPIAAPVRLGAPCDAGVAAATLAGAPWIACGRRGDDARSDEGGVQVLELRDGRVSARASFGPVGPDGEGVALDVAGTPRVGWQEARGAISAAWVAELREGARPERISPPRFRASRPALATRADGTPLVAWSETWLDARGDVEGRIELRAGTAAARAVADLAFDDPHPTLRGSGDDLVLAFRDRRPARSRPRVQIARVTGEPGLDRIESASHANAIGDAPAIPCGDHVYVVAPRTHSRTERLVSVRRYTRALEPAGPEQQIYEHGSAFEHGDAQCVGGHLLIVIGGRPSPVHEHGTIRAVQVSCDAP